MGSAHASDDRQPRLDSPTQEPDTVVETQRGAPVPVGSGTSIGRYFVLEPLGVGGMGIVYRGYDPQLEREVALKTVRLDADSGGEQARLLHEARAMAQLAHRNVVGIYDVELLERPSDPCDADERQVLLVMELVEGVTLATWVGRRRRPWATVVRVFVRAGKGIAAAHAVGLLHRDFKPTNVLIAHADDAPGSDRPQRVQVADFGLACATAQGPTTAPSGSVVSGSEVVSLGRGLTQAGVAMGTPRYMPPEQHLGRRLGPAADQYAFCVALWEALTGQRPFDGEGGQLLRSKLDGPPPLAPERSLPRSIGVALQRGLDPKPDRRWPSMQALLAAIDPDRRRRRGAVVVGSLSGIAVVAAALGAGFVDDDVCDDARERLGSAWDADRRATVHDAFDRTQVPYAEGLWDKLSPQLDDYAQQWADTHQRACETAQSPGPDASADALDLQMGCLRRSRNALHAVSTVLADADGAVVRKAHQLVDGLPPVDRCIDIDRLRRGERLPPPAVAQQVDELEAQLSVARANRDAGRLVEAGRTLTAIHEPARRTGFDSFVARVDLEAAEIAEDLAQHVDAQAEFEASLRRAYRAGDHATALAAALKLLRLAGDEGYQEERGRAYERIARGLVALSGATEAQVRLLSYVAARDAKAGHEAAAIAGYTRALEVLARAPENHVLTQMSVRSNFALVLGASGDLEREEAEQRAVLETLLEVLGERHPAVGSAYNNLGMTLGDRGQFGAAEEFVRTGLEIKRDAYGDGHPSVARAYRNLSSLLGERGAMQESIAACRAAVAAQEAANGPDHPAVAAELSNLGVALRRTGAFAEAAELQRRALEIEVAALGPDHPDVGKSRGNLANTLFMWGHYDEAVAEGRTTLQIFSTRMGPEHPLTQLAGTNLAAALRGAGKLAEAEPFLRAAIASTQRMEGPRSIRLADLRGNLGNLLCDLDRPSDALAHYRAALEIDVAARGPGHPSTAHRRQGLALALGQLGQTTAAERELRAVLAVREATLEPDDMEIATTLRHLAALLVERGRTGEAEALLQRAFAITRDPDLPAGDRAAAGFAYGALLWRRAPRRRTEAVQIVRTSLEDYALAASHGAAVDADPVEAWLAKHDR